MLLRFPIFYTLINFIVYVKSSHFITFRDNDIKVAVSTSDTRASTVLALGQLGVLDMVDRLICGDDKDNVPKPAPDNVYKICKELGVKPCDTAMIGILYVYNIQYVYLLYIFLLCFYCFTIIILLT